MAFLLTVQICYAIIVTNINRNLSYDFSFMILIIVRMFILTGRGARMRGEEPQGEGSRRFAPVSPLLKVLPLALPLSLSSPL